MGYLKQLESAKQGTREEKLYRVGRRFWKEFFLNFWLRTALYIYMECKTIQGLSENKCCTADNKTEIIKVEEGWGMLEILQRLKDSINILLIFQASSFKTRKAMP